MGWTLCRICGITKPNRRIMHYSNTANWHFTQPLTLNWHDDSFTLIKLHHLLTSLHLDILLPIICNTRYKKSYINPLTLNEIKSITFCITIWNSDSYILQTHRTAHEDLVPTLIHFFPLGFNSAELVHGIVSEWQTVKAAEKGQKSFFLGPAAPGGISNCMNRRMEDWNFFSHS
jgi:hypothetical protein